MRDSIAIGLFVAAMFAAALIVSIATPCPGC